MSTLPYPPHVLLEPLIWPSLILCSRKCIDLYLSNHHRLRRRIEEENRTCENFEGAPMRGTMIGARGEPRGRVDEALRGRSAQAQVQVRGYKEEKLELAARTLCFICPSFASCALVRRLSTQCSPLVLLSLYLSISLSTYLSLSLSAREKSRSLRRRSDEILVCDKPVSFDRVQPRNAQPVQLNSTR